MKRCGFMLLAAVMTVITYPGINSIAQEGERYNLVAPTNVPPPPVPTEEPPMALTTPSKVQAPISVEGNTTLLVGNPDNFQVPETAILAPTTPVKFGKVVSVRVKPIETRPKGLFAVTYLWRMHPVPDDLTILGDSTQALFGTGIDSATVNIELIASYLFLDKDSNNQPLVAQRVVVVDKEITISGGPTPAPTPVPTPPTIDIPDSPLGLTKLSYQWVAAISRPDVAARKQEALALSRSFRGIASTIMSNVEYNVSDGTHYLLDDQIKILRATKSSNNLAIPQSIASWRPWFLNLDTKLKELKASGKLESPADYAVAWNELGMGLEAASR